MKRFAWLALLFLPVSASGQEPTPAPPPEDRAGAIRLAVDLEAAGAALAAGVPQQTQRVQPVPAPPDPEPRRRPSMVGYVGDSSIGSAFRVRFDAGYGITAVDRAEFFYAKCGCYRDLPSDHPFFDPEAPGPGPGIVTDLNFQQLYLLGEYAFGNQLSVFGELPVRWIQPQDFVPGFGSFGNQSGLSDLRLGVKAAAVALPDQTVTFLLQLNAPTGDSRQGLGTDHWSVEPALLYYGALTDRLAFEGQFGGILPTRGSAGLPTAADERFDGNVLYYGGGLSYQVYDEGDVAIAPVVELVGWRVLGGFQTLDFADVSGMNIVNVKLGLRASARGGSSVYVGWGRALTDAVWYENILRAEYRLAF
jgi:hypothetical protein